MDPGLGICLPALLSLTPSSLCPALAMVLLPWLLTAHGMTRETRKPDGKANEAEGFRQSLERDLAQRQSRREKAGKTGEAGMEREKNSCGKNGKRCTAPRMEHEGDHHAKEGSECCRDRREKSGTVWSGELRLMMLMSLGLSDTWQGETWCYPGTELNSTGGQKVTMPCPVGHWMNFSTRPSA